MLQKLLAPIVAWMVALMAAMGPLGVMVLMAIESACIPLPSEVIMPFAGYLAFKGQLTFFGLGAGNPVAQIWIAVVFHGLFGSFRGSLEQGTDIDVETNIGISCCHHFCSTVMAILSHLGDHDARTAAFKSGKFVGHFAGPCKHFVAGRLGRVNT